jgi:outer membrane protein assembly factor BamB
MVTSVVVDTARFEPWHLLQPRALAVLTVSLIGVIVSWQLSLSWCYLLGLAVVLAWGLFALDHRVLWQLALTLAVAGVGIGGPWLALRLSYQPVGVEVAAPVDLMTDVVSDEGVVFFAGYSGVVAVDDSGAELWRADMEVDDVWPLGDGRLLVATWDDLVLLDADGRHVWSRPLPEGLGWTFGFVARDDDVLVHQGCALEGSRPTDCRYTAMDATDGSTRWELWGTWAPGWPLANGEMRDKVRTIDTSLFTVLGESGSIEVRDAGTGEVIREVPADGVTPVLVDDALLLVHDGEPCRAELWRDGGQEWTAEFDCALWRAPTDQYEDPGRRIGDAFWVTPVEGQGRLVVDLGTGTVRVVDAEESHALGAGVDVEVRDGGLTVRDPVDGRPLWEVSLALGNVGSLRVSGDLVVVARETGGMLLREWFAPRDGRRHVVDVYDARTGELVASFRRESEFFAPIVADDRFVADVSDADGHTTMRMIHH